MIGKKSSGLKFSKFFCEKLMPLLLRFKLRMKKMWRNPALENTAILQLAFPE